MILFIYPPNANCSILNIVQFILAHMQTLYIMLFLILLKLDQPLFSFSN